MIMGNNAYALLFLNFLNNNGLLDDFCKDFFCDRRVRDAYSEYKGLERMAINEHLTSAHPKTYIIVSFQWHKSSKGCEFWNAVYDKWLEVLNEKLV